MRVPALVEFSMPGRLLTTGCVAAAALAVAHAQQQPPTFGTTTRTVAVYATVTDLQGRLTVPDSCGVCPKTMAVKTVWIEAVPVECAFTVTPEGSTGFVRTIHRFGYAFRGEAIDLMRTDTNGAICRLVWSGGSATLSKGEHVIGRDAGVPVLLDSPSVSRRHARIRVEHDGHATFEDLGSKNGSRVRSRRADGPVALADGDVITTGIVELTFRIIRPAVPTESG
jgi:hypothetical protein